MEMASTLTGRALYAAHGYQELELVHVPLENGLTLEIIVMGKSFTGA